MTDNDSRKIVPKGFFQEIGLQLKLILRLMRDSRVNLFLKAIPIGTLIYLVIPDLVIGPFDDAAIVGLGLYLFIEMCPPQIVEEHRQAILKEMQGNFKPQGEVIEGKFRDISNNPNASSVGDEGSNTDKKEGV
jgi:uncharacterized membrane protein YkvA (DUF1232 family)